MSAEFVHAPWSKKLGWVVTEGGCHVWTGCISNHGYGQTGIPGTRKRARVHRLRYEKERGPIPDGMHLGHICRNRACCNPEHLRVVTPRENVTENSLSLPALNLRKTHCKRGHPFTPENTRLRDGGRYCRQCARDAERRERERAKSQSADASRPKTEEGGS